MTLATALVILALIFATLGCAVAGSSSQANGIGGMMCCWLCLVLYLTLVFAGVIA